MHHFYLAVFVKPRCCFYIIDADNNILSAMLKEVIRRVRPNPPLESPSPPTRISIHPMGHLSIPSFRWWDGDKIPTHDKLPLLGLKLSSHSFLDTSLEDDLSAATVYTIKTTQAFTTVLRFRNEDNPIEIATINWPAVVSKNEPDKNVPLIKMRDCHCWTKGPVFLRSGPNPNSSRKFAIPDYSHAMKWKRYGSSYWCTTSSIKGPIATMDLADGQQHISLAIYETLRDKSDPQALPTYKGVSFLLLDYLIVTALLCVTDVSAWMKLGDMQDMAPLNDTNSGQELGDVPHFPNHSSAMSSGELRSVPSNTSLPTTISGVPPSRLYTAPTPEASSSRWYADTPIAEDPPTMADSSKDYLTLLNDTKPNPTTEAVQDSASDCHTSVRKRKSSRNIPSVLPLLSQLSRPTASTSSLPKVDLSRPLNQPTKTNIHSPQPSLALESFLSSEPPNFSKSSRASRSVSYRRPLPKPPGESTPRRTQSSTPPPINSLATSSSFRSLPPTPTPASAPLVEVSESDESTPLVSGHSRRHPRSPPMTKASQEELTQWVHGLTDPQRALPPTPLPETVVFDLPPPSYSSIYFAQGAKPDCIPTSNTTAPST